MIGTGQTSWLQGIQYSIVLDSLINDFVSGEIEHIIFTGLPVFDILWDRTKEITNFMIILMNF